jgi:hypothetical protein
MRLLATLCLGLSLSAACTSSDIGKACDKQADCGGELICDVHDGKGTCQEAHGHEAGETTSQHDSDDTTHHESEATDHDATAHDEPTGHHDSEDTAHHDSDASTGGSSTGG